MPGSPSDKRLYTQLLGALNKESKSDIEQFYNSLFDRILSGEPMGGSEAENFADLVLMACKIGMKVADMKKIIAIKNGAVANANTILSFFQSHLSEPKNLQIILNLISGESKDIGHESLRANNPSNDIWLCLFAERMSNFIVACREKQPELTSENLTVISANWLKLLQKRDPGNTREGDLVLLLETASILLTVLTLPKVREDLVERIFKKAFDEDQRSMMTISHQLSYFSPNIYEMDHYHEDGVQREKNRIMNFHRCLDISFPPSIAHSRSSTFAKTSSDESAGPGPTSAFQPSNRK